MVRGMVKIMAGIGFLLLYGMVPAARAQRENDRFASLYGGQFQTPR